MSKSFLKCYFLTRPLRRKYFLKETNSAEAYSEPGKTFKTIFT